MAESEPDHSLPDGISLHDPETARRIFLARQLWPDALPSQILAEDPALIADQIALEHRYGILRYLFAERNRNKAQ